MIPTLISSGMGQAHVFYYDSQELDGEIINAHAKVASSVDEQVLAAVIIRSPDIVLFSHLISWGDRNVKAETWQKIREQGVKVVGVWHEGVAPDVIRHADMLNGCVDFHVLLDTREQHVQYTKQPEKYLGLYDPRDPLVFFDGADYDTTWKRDIFMSFCGTILGKAHRAFGIGVLWANGIPCEAVGRPLGGIKPNETAALLRRSLIGINFADAGNGNIRHYKGRVAEVMLSGACLFERKNSEIGNILEPFRDYIEWEEYDDLVHKARYFAEHRDELAQIAESGKKKAQRLLTGSEFWKAIFERAGL